MKQILTICLSLFIITFSVGQKKMNSKIDNKKEINEVVNIFMKCLLIKDTAVFNNLFHKGPVTWTGVIKPASLKRILEKNPGFSDYFNNNYKEFYLGISDKEEKEEKFDNIQIIEDGCIASATFDYSFWKKGKIINWGSEHWGLIKTKGAWKITSVIFSMEFTVFSLNQPTLRERKHLRL